MVPLRHMIWLLLTACSFCIALVAFALSRQIDTLDYGWMNGALVFLLWLGVAQTLKHWLVDDHDPISRPARNIPVSTLEPRRR